MPEIQINQLGKSLPAPLRQQQPANDLGAKEETMINHLHLYHNTPWILLSKKSLKIFSLPLNVFVFRNTHAFHDPGLDLPKDN